MTHTIEPISHYVAGDSIELVFTVTSDDIDDLIDVTAQWWLLDSAPQRSVTSGALTENSLASSDDAGISVSVNSDAMTIVVEIDKDETDALGGEQYHVLRAEGATQGRKTWGGRFKIEQP